MREGEDKRHASMRLRATSPRTVATTFATTIAVTVAVSDTIAATASSIATALTTTPMRNLVCGKQQCVDSEVWFHCLRGLCRVLYFATAPTTLQPCTMVAAEPTALTDAIATGLTLPITLASLTTVGTAAAITSDNDQRDQLWRIDLSIGECTLRARCECVDTATSRSSIPMQSQYYAHHRWCEQL
jgi:hypothetical protein